MTIPTMTDAQWQDLLITMAQQAQTRIGLYGYQSDATSIVSFAAEYVRAQRIVALFDFMRERVTAAAMNEIIETLVKFGIDGLTMFPNAEYTKAMNTVLAKHSLPLIPEADAEGDATPLPLRGRAIDRLPEPTREQENQNAGRAAINRLIEELGDRLRSRDADEQARIINRLTGLILNG